MILLRLLYFVAVGWWLGLIVAALAYLLCATIIFLPFGLILFNRLPTVIWLEEEYEADEDYHFRDRREAIPFLLRAVWFFLVGWELGLLALGVGYLVAATLIGLPLGIYILNRIPLLMTLNRRYA